MMTFNRWMLATVLASAMLTSAPAGIDAAAPRPHMRAALSALQTAGRELKKATHDKSGHRVKAIALVNKAIREVQMGIAAARK